MKGTRTLAAALLWLGACDQPEPPARTTSQQPPPPTGAWLRDATAASGLDFVHEAGRTAERHLPETMGAGAALVDIDGDLDLDLYLVQSGSMPVAGARPSQANQLFVNDGAGSFSNATDELGDGAHTGYGMGVAAGDVNGDGHVDLYITNLGPDALLRGEQGRRFTDVTAESGLGDPRWTSGALFFDPDRDGDLDLFVLGYVEVDLTQPPWCGKREEGYRSYCHPDQFQGLPDRLHENDGTGRFRDVTAESGLSDSAGKGLGAIAFDFDDDGATDLYVANDSVENRLWRGHGDGTFEDATLLSSTGVNGSGMTEAGMGLAVGDVDGDERLDLFVTNFDEESNTLYRNEGGGLFSDYTARSGLDAPSRMPVGFGTVMADLDRDGNLDIAVANGHIVDNIQLYNDAKTHAQRALLFVGAADGRFTASSDTGGALCAEPFVGRGLYAGDLDEDGDLDLLLTQNGGPARLFENVTTAPPARGVRLEPSAGQRLRATYGDGSRRLFPSDLQTSYLGQGDPRVWVPSEGLEQVELGTPRQGGYSWSVYELD